MNESNIQQNTGKANDEIDIFEFCSRMWNAFKNFLTGVKDLLISVIIYTLRKSLWIISFALIGAILGFAYYGFKKPYYTSMLEGTSGGVDNKVVIDHVNKLSMMVKKPEILAKYLTGMTVEQAEEIRMIKAFYGIDINRNGKPDYIDENESYNPKDTMQSRVSSVFYIKVALYDESILPVFRESLFRYINGNSYIQDLYKIDKRQKEELIIELKKEIAKIDTVQRVVITNKTSSVEVGQKVYLMGNEPEIRLFYVDVLTLHGQKQALEKSLEISDKPVVVVQDFTPAQFIEKKSVYYVVRLGLAMAVLGFVCAILWQYRKPLWNIITEEQGTNS